MFRSKKIYSLLQRKDIRFQIFQSICAMHLFGRAILAAIAVVTLFVGASIASGQNGPMPSVNFLFETFSPYSVVKFFEFSDKGWNISENCLKNMYGFLEGLQRGSVWAMKLYDSTQYYGGNAFSGDRYRLDTSTQCRHLQKEYLNVLKMHWSLKTNTTVVPFPVQLINAKFQLEMQDDVYEIFTIQQSICFPENCDNNDLQQILAAPPLPGNLILNNMTLIEFRSVDGVYDVFQDSSFYTLISLLAIVLAITLCSYLYERFWEMQQHDITEEKKNSETDSGSSLPSDLTVDDLNCALEHVSKLSNCDKNSLTKVNMHHSAECMTINNMNNNNHVNLVKVKKVKTRNSATISLDIIAGNCEFAKTTKKFQIPTNSGPFAKLLVSFSWRMNLNDFKGRTRGEWEISSIRGLQVLCTILLISAYTSSMMEYLSNNRHTLTVVTRKLLAFVKRNSTYLVDMFFFLSGANLTYLYFKTSRQGKCKVLEQILHFVAMITYKICCIILPYFIILLSVELLSKYSYANSALDLPSFDHMTCSHDKWLNVLYIENFFPISERCMLWTWFISLEVHFFIVACLVLLLAQIHPKYAGAICTGIFVTSILATTVVEVDYMPAVRQNVEHELTAFYLLFDKIWVRIPPYLLGMCLGYTLYKTQGKFKMNIFVIVFGWLACVLILAGFAYGFHTVEFRVNPWVRAIISTLGHTIWSMVLFWIVLASISQYGGTLANILTSKVFNSLGKLTNCCLLVGPLIIRTLLQSNETGINLSLGHLFISWIGFLLSSFSAAFILFMLFEAPVLILLKMGYKLLKKTAL